MKRPVGDRQSHVPATDQRPSGRMRSGSSALRVRLADTPAFFVRAMSFPRANRAADELDAVVHGHGAA
ncbi:MAG: hypothetical protein ACAI25_12295, partial [Planctomycetota bacterium]